MKVLGAIVNAFDPLDSDPGPNLLNLLHLKWPQDFSFGLHQTPPGPLNRMHILKLRILKSAPKARTLDSFDSFDSDPGPHLMDLMNRKSPPPRPGLLD